jgi:hypothetical protein
MGRAGRQGPAGELPVRTARPIAALARCSSGAALTEFALALPLLLTTGLWGVEVAHKAIMQMRLSQVAVLVADNASRVGENSLLGETKLYEADINDVLLGAQVQGGTSFGLYERGRVILSSLEVVPDTEDRQYIHWQRCMGTRRHASSFGTAGDGEHSTFPGMGPRGEEIQAVEGEAVMFVEVVYDYEPLFAKVFVKSTRLSATAAFNVRQNRDLSQIYQRNPDEPDPIAACDKFGSASVGR